MHIFPGWGKTAVAMSHVHPPLHAEEIVCSILSIYAAGSASSPGRVAPSQKRSLSMLFSCLFQGSVLLTWQRVPKPAGAVLKQGATRSVSSLWHLTHALFFFFSQELHFSFPRRQDIPTEMWSDHFLRQWTPQASQGRLLLALKFWVVAKLGGERLGRISNDTLVILLANTSVVTLKWGEKRKF